MNKKNYIRGILFASAGSIGWGVSGVCSQYLFMEYDLDSGWLTAVRMVLSGIALLIIAIPGEGRGILRIWTSRCDIMWLLAFALLGLLMCQYTFLGAVKYSNSATAMVLQSLNVIIMAVLVAARNRKRMSAAQTAAVFLALAGTYLIATGGAVLFLASVAWVIPEGLDLTAWVMIAIIVLIGTAGGFSAFLEGVRYIGPVKATLIGCLEPASATVLSSLFLGTRFTLAELIGFCAIILTVFLSVSGKKE